MERKLRGGVDEVLLQDRGIRHGSGDKDKAHDGPADRVREGLEHSLEDHGRGSRLRFETDIGSEGRIRRPKDQRTAFRCAFPAHVADPGPEVFPTVHRLDQVEVIGIYHGTFDAVQISFDRGVQMVQLRRSASNSYGFSTKSIAPPFIASTAASIVPSPVIMTTAVSGLTTRRRCRTSSPVALGIRRSRRATSNDSRSTVRSASPPSAAVTMACPSSRRSAASSSRRVLSSSATRIFMPPPFEGGGP